MLRLLRLLRLFINNINNTLKLFSTIDINKIINNFIIINKANNLPNIIKVLPFLISSLCALRVIKKVDNSLLYRYVPKIYLVLLYY